MGGARYVRRPSCGARNLPDAIYYSTCGKMARQPPLFTSAFSGR